MRDLHDPNNPDYEKESELTREIIYDKLTNEEINFLDEEETYHVRKSVEYCRRIGKIKKEINDLMEFVEQETEQKFIANRLKKIMEL